MLAVILPARSANAANAGPAFSNLAAVDEASVKFSARAAGTVKIKVNSPKIYDSNSRQVTPDHLDCVTVTVAAPAGGGRSQP